MRGGNVWEAPFKYGDRVYGAGKPMKTKDMTMECDLRTCMFLAISGERFLSIGT